jgi:heme exporter protein D
MVRYDWPQALLRSVLWLVLGPLLGVVAALVYGEFGSIIFVWMGAIVGVSGAIANAALMASARFMAAGRIAQWVYLAVGATLLPLLWAMATMRDDSSIAILVEILLCSLGMAALISGVDAWLSRARRSRWY